MRTLQSILKQKGYYSGEIDGDFGKISKAAATKFCRDLMTSKNMSWTPKGFVAIRTTNHFTNKFIDYLFLIVNNEVVLAVPCSTVPGWYYVYNPLTVGGITGAAVLVADKQYLNCWTFTTAKSWANLWTGMPYFMQTGPVEIWRDGNKNNIMDATIRTTGFYGINIHRGWLGNLVNNASAGCQVVPDAYWKLILPYFTNGEKASLSLFNL